MTPPRRSRYGYRSRPRTWPSAAALAGVLAAPVLALALLAGLGRWLPEVQSATRTASFPEPPDVVWQLLLDLDTQPTWRRGLTRVERLPDQQGRPAWLEYRGGAAEAFWIADARPPLRLVTERVPATGPAEASWTWELAREAEGSRLTLTRRVRVEQPVARAIGMIMRGPGREADRALADLGQRLAAAERTRTTALNR